MTTGAVDQLKAAIAALPATKDGLKMETLLDPAIAALPDLLKDKAVWNSLYIDYEPPFLMRLYLPVTAGERTAYLSLHYFFAVPGEDIAEKSGLKNPYAGRSELADKESVNNYHPHPWASAFHIFEGSYSQHVGMAAETGYSPELRPQNPVLQKQDAAHNRYAFNHPLIWHRVLPAAGAPVSTMMVTYMPEDWGQTGPKPAVKQRCLTDQERDFMLAHFTRIVTPPKPKTTPAFKP